MPDGQLALGEPPAPARALHGRLHAGAGPTEQQAAARGAQTGRRSQRVRVLEWLQQNPDGGTDYEISRALEIVRPHVAGTRREELIRDGWMVVDSGVRRPTDTGSPAVVWRLISFQ